MHLSKIKKKMDDLEQDICFGTEPEFHAAKSNGYNQRLIQKIKNNGIRVYIECGFAEIFNSHCHITVLQNPAVCGIQEFSANFNAVCIFLLFFCSVFTRICAVFVPPYFWFLGKVASTTINIISRQKLYSDKNPFTCHLKRLFLS